MSNKKDTPSFKVLATLITSAFYEATGRFSGINLCESRPHKLLSEISAFIDGKEYVDVSGLIHVLNKHRTGKMSSHANEGLDLIINRVKTQKELDL